MLRPAATVVLVRDRADGIEVLMMRRGEGLSFLGGMWVFPGGRMEAADSSPEALARLPAPARDGGEEILGTLDGGRLTAEQALGHRVAACRESFEEAGVLLAQAALGKPCDPGLVARLQARRAEVVADAAAFARLLAEESLYLDATPLVYWSHWITPSVEAKRFDTRFFVVPLPEDQAISADLSELTEHAWIDPATIGPAFDRGEIRMVPPTLLTLEDLADCRARHGSLRAMLVAERHRATPPIMPKIQAADDFFHIVMPWDPRYAGLSGEGCRVPEPFPAHFARRRSSVSIPRERRTL